VQPLRNRVFARRTFKLMARRWSRRFSSQIPGKSASGIGETQFHVSGIFFANAAA
jgi:hypothetical protein